MELALCFLRFSQLLISVPVHMESAAKGRRSIGRERHKSGLVSPIEKSAPLRQVERKEVNTHNDRVRGSFDDK